MKNWSALVLALALGLGLSGCKKKKCMDSCSSKKIETRADIYTSADVTTQEDSSDESEDEDIFDDSDEENDEVESGAPEKPSTVAFAESMEEFDWVNEDNEDGSLKTVYFEFDKSGIESNQKDALKKDAEFVKNALKEAKNSNLKATVVVEGHACSSAGSPAYNLILSETRARHVADELIDMGVSADAVKVVGRGQEAPAIVDGKPVVGGRSEQAPNRRAEIRVIYA